MPKFTLKPTLSNILLKTIEKKSLDIKVSMPGRVLSYDIETQKAIIQPLFKIKYKAYPNSEVDFPPIVEVPVHWFSSNNGNAFIHLPLKKNDLGMLIFADRALDNYLFSKPDNNDVIQSSYHGKTRHHDLTDGWFVPGVLPFSKSLLDPSSEDLVIKNNKMRIELGDDGTIAIRKDNTDELIDVLITILEYIRDGKVLTALGAQGWIASDFLLINTMITKLMGFKKD